MLSRSEVRLGEPSKDMAELAERVRMTWIVTRLVTDVTSQQYPTGASSCDGTYNTCTSSLSCCSD